MRVLETQKLTLPRSFYARPALEVAPELLGKTLVVTGGAHRRAGRVVEVEAYVGEHDLACHASKGRTRRTEVLYGPPGHAYVYLIYGMYRCFNVVTDLEHVASAVLVRAVEPLEGIAPGQRTDGPGKLCRAMDIELAHNRLELSGPPLWLEDGPGLPRRRIARGPRIGVDYAGRWASKPYRFWEKDNPHVSRR